VSADTAADSPYIEPLLRSALRVLGMLDREPLSPTRGCMDRTYWAWKFTDFPGARFQEGICFLSFLQGTSLPGSPYFGNTRLLAWIAGAFDYWCSIQRRRGDFDEAYPYESSLAATAFTSFYLSEAFSIVGEGLPATTANSVRHCLAKAGSWLIRNDETHGFLSNHLAAAAAALYHIERITGEARFGVRGRYFLDKILAHQSDEGWYDEYGGADPGYQTHGSFYLARIWQLTGDEALLASLDRSFEFLAHFVHPDGSLGGEYTSRNTQTYYPAAFEMMAGDSAAASWIAEALRPSVRSMAAAGLDSVDPYNLFPLLNNYVFAHQGFEACREKRREPKGPAPAPGQVHFEDAGILKVRRERYDLYVGLHKGGVAKLFDRRAGKLAYSDSGYIGRRGGKLVSSQWIDKERRIDIEENEICIEGCFYQVPRPIMQPLTFLGFRIFTLTLGRLPTFAYWLKSILVKALIYRKREIDVTFTRRFLLWDDKVEVEDLIKAGDDTIDELLHSERFATIHMGSSRYFVPNELMDNPYDADEAIDPRDLKAGLTRRRTIPFG
jgi:hypothetical protein